MYCPNCGEMLPEGSKFCGVCGSNLAEVYANAAKHSDENAGVASAKASNDGRSASIIEVENSSWGASASCSLKANEEDACPSTEMQAGTESREMEDAAAKDDRENPSDTKSWNKYVLPAIIIVAVIAIIIVINVIIAVMPTKEERWQEQYDLGQQYLLDGDYEQAIVAFTKAIKIDGNNADAYMGRAEAYLGGDVSGSSEENLYLALSDYETSLSLGAEEGSVYVSMGSVYLALGQEDEALADYEIAFELETVPEEVYINVARIYIGMDRLEEAVILLDEASDRYPESEEIETVWAEASYDPFDFSDLALEVWDGSVASGFSGGEGTLFSPWRISNGAELAYFAEYAATSEGADDYYILMADIQMNDLDDWGNWLENPPANEYEGDIDFSGNFDGRGYTIYGLYSHTGLIQCLSSGGSVSYVNLVGCVTVAENRDAAGGICIEIDGDSGITMVDSCSFSGIVTGDDAGGIVGEIDSSGKGSVTIQNCTVRGSVVSDSDNSGGIIGNVECKSSVDIQYCVNYGSVTNKGSNVSRAGGIIGEIYLSGTNACATITYCGNLGTVTTYSEGAFDLKEAGGIIGELSLNSSLISISDCFNSGKIVAEGNTYNNVSRGVIGAFSGGKSGSILVQNTVYRDGVSAEYVVYDSPAYYNAGMYEILTESNVSRLSLTEMMEAGYPIVDRGDDTVMPWNRSSVSEAEENTETDLSGVDASEERSSADEENDAEDNETEGDNAEEEGTELAQTDADTLDWASVYLELLGQVSVTTDFMERTVYRYDYGYGDKDYTGFSLLYIDDDDVPELVMYGTTTESNPVFTISQDGALDFTVMGDFTYVEKGNVLIGSGGRQGLYYDKVYSIEDGQWVLEGSGSYDTNQGETLYTWNDVSVTEEEYNELLGQYTSGVTLTDNDYEPDYTLEELTAYLSKQ